MVYKDQHLHYTGSLPLSYIWLKIKESCGSLVDYILLEDLFSRNISRKLKEKDFSDKTYSLFKEEIKGLFDSKNNYARNYEKFFKLYKFIQKLTKPRENQKIEQVYREGTGAIISCLSGLKVSEIDIFAGPLLDLEKTKSRLQGMIQGFKDNQRLPVKGSIRLTFISTKNGYINLTQQSLEKLLDYLISNKKISDHISGFDFSGNEDVNNIDFISSTARRLSIFNKKFYSQNNRKLKISVHAGEDFVNISYKKYLDYFDKLLNLPIDSIGHGVFLWIPDDSINYSKKVNKQRRELLKKVVEKNIELEICPTSNLLFSPLKSYRDIPFNFFNKIGLKYSVNTDNMTILSTDIKTEWEKVLDFR
ncbi:hypothetical protein KBI33_02105 [Candidatus Shapirobacteria bacterium]|nr:hypothetical protein [Candidatus Shapirobacteria bacterium]